VMKLSKEAAGNKAKMSDYIGICVNTKGVQVRRC